MFNVCSSVAFNLIKNFPQDGAFVQVPFLFEDSVFWK